MGKCFGKYVGDSDGSSSRYDNLLYGFHISEFRDGSNGVDLTGCLLGYSIIQEIEAKIYAQIEKDLAELETL